MKVSVYIDQALFNQALKATKTSILTPSQQIAHWAEMGRVMETKKQCSLRLLQNNQKKE